jgi:hypothetical protein
MQGVGSKGMLTTLVGQGCEKSHMGQFNANMGLDYTDISACASINQPSKLFMHYQYF